MAHHKGTDPNGIGDIYTALWKANLTNADEHRVRLDCYIPKSVKLCFDDGNQGTVVHADSHKVWLYKTMFRAGFRLPFTSITRGRLCHLGLAPHQIVPIAWWVFLACGILWPMVLRKESPLTV
jgi:hypothetical protein